jgi:transcriptional regulator with XRE-family HTH domain
MEACLAKKLHWAILRSPREEPMPLPSANHVNHTPPLTGHALRNANLRQRSLARAREAPRLARLVVHIRAKVLGLTRLECARRSGISRGTLRDLELGIHTPTRRVMQRFLSFCEERGANPEHLEELCQIYAGPCDTLARFLARLELRAGSPFELARRVGISHCAYWEHRRGHFPMPLALLRRLCAAVGVDAVPADALWYKAERQRLLERGYPEALAEFWVLCARNGYAERQLFKLGLSTKTARRLRYLEVPPWPDIAKVAGALCPLDQELQKLKKLWRRDEQVPPQESRQCFGLRLKALREQRGISRRQLADLFGLGGKKPARIIKYIEEDGFYSAQAYPAGLVAMVADNGLERPLLELWQERRQQFHRRRRPEMCADLRLARELYGLGLKDMEAILGYTSQEYQRIERGVCPLLDSAHARILEAIHEAGRRRVAALQKHKEARAAEHLAWRLPPSVLGLVKLLADRDGGLIPLARRLKKAGLKGLWPGRLRDIARGKRVPAWPIVEAIGRASEVAELSEVRRDWAEQYRAALRQKCASPLGAEIRLLIAEVAVTVRAFSPKLGFSPSVLVRDLQRLDRDAPARWSCVERILRAAGLPSDCERWKTIRALWSTAEARCRKTGEAMARRQLAL